ncbi:MAG: type II secretion system protein, partial [Planctomycetota bacterium]
RIETGNRYTAGRGGFTLAEVMFAIILLGVCLAMVAGAFPAALEMNDQSFAMVLGGIITDNGLAVAKASLEHPVAGAGSGQLVDVTSRLGGDDVTYPTGSDGRRGFRVLTRRMAGDANDYLLVIASYEKTKAAHEIKTEHFPVNVDAGAESFSTSDPGKFQPNGVVISDSGPWAYIKSIDGGKVTLERPLSRDEDVSGLTLVYEVSGSDSPISVMNPGTTVLVSRTGLRSRP